MVSFVTLNLESSTIIGQAANEWLFHVDYAFSREQRPVMPPVAFALVDVYYRALDASKAWETVMKRKVFPSLRWYSNDTFCFY